MEKTTNELVLDSLIELYHACETANEREELPYEIDGSILDRARHAIEKAGEIANFI